MASENTENMALEEQDSAVQAAVHAVLEDLEGKYVQVQRAKDALELQHKDQSERMHNAENELQQLRQEQADRQKLQKQVQSEQIAKERAEEEKRLQQERCDRLQTEGDALREEITRLNERNIELTTELGTATVQAKLNESQAVPLFHEKERIQTELIALQSHAEWLEQELSARQQDYRHLQQESRDRSIQNQLQLDVVTNNLEAANAKLQVQQKLEHELQNQMERTSRDNLQLKQDLEELQLTSKQEAVAQQRLIEQLQRNLAESQERHLDAVRNVEHLRETAQQALNAHESEIVAAKTELQNKYAALLQEQAETYEAKLKSAANSNEMQLMIPTAAPTPNTQEDEEEQQPLSMTDLYQKWHETKQALLEETINRKRWQLQMQRVQADLAQKAPALTRQRRDYERAVDQLAAYQTRLEAALRERDDYRAETEEARRQTATASAQMRQYKMEAHDLALQVQAFLTEKAGGNPNTDIPTSIQEIQSQNQRLLAEHKRLTEQVMDLEQRLHSDSLVANEEKLTALNEERKEQEAMVEKIVQQRDLYRALLYKHDSEILGDKEASALELVQQQSERAKKFEGLNNELEGQLKVAQSERDRAIQDQEQLRERLLRLEAVHKEITDNTNRLERDLLSSRSEVARTQADATYHSTKANQLEESLQRAREETTQVNQARIELQMINADLQQSISATNAERGRLEGQVRQAEARVRLVETQLATARAAEQQQAQDNQQMRGEIARQGTLIELVRRIESNITAKADSDKESLLNQVKSLSSQLESGTGKHAEHVESMVSRIQELEQQIGDLQCSNQKNQLDALKFKNNLLESQNELQALKSVCKTLETQLRSAKRKLGEDQDAEDVEVTLQARIDALELELEGARSQVKSLEERAESYKNMAQSSEKALLELQTSTNEFNAGKNKELSDLMEQLDRSKQECLAHQEAIRKLTADLVSQQDEHGQVQEKLEAQILALKSDIESNSKDFESAKATAAALLLDMDNARSEAIAAQNNYERELSLHSQARTALRVAQELADEESRLRKIAEDKLEGLQVEFKQKTHQWEEEKLASEKSSQLLETSLAEARQQNKVLHEQLDTLDRMVTKNQQSRVEAAAGSEDSAAEIAGVDSETQTLIEEQKQVIRFLRSENELVQAQLDTAKRMADRERAAATAARHSLEESRAELIARQAYDGKEVGVVDNTEALSNKLREMDIQLELHKDSNKLLREENEKLSKHLSSIQTELESVKKSAQPAEDVQRELRSFMASLEAEKASLVRELELWKARMTSLVSNFNQIDPEEYNKLQLQVKELQQEKESQNAWKKATEEENTRIRGIAKKLNLQSKEQQKTIEAQQESIEKLTVQKSALESASSTSTEASKERAILKEKYSKIEKDFASTQTELNGANSRIERLVEKLREYQSAMRTLQAREKTLTQQIADLKQLSTSELLHGSPSKPSTSNSSTKASKDDETKGEKEKLIASDLVKDSLVNVILPTIPEEGFRFGPNPVNEVMPLVENLPAAEQSSSAAAEPSEQKFPSTEAPPSQNVTTDSKASGMNKEQSIKEKLLQKKLLQKRMELEMRQKKAELEKRKRALEEQAGMVKVVQREKDQPETAIARTPPVSPIPTPARTDSRYERSADPAPAKKLKTEDAQPAQSGVSTKGKTIEIQYLQSENDVSVAEKPDSTIEKDRALTQEANKIASVDMKEKATESNSEAKPKCNDEGTTIEVFRYEAQNTNEKQIDESQGDQGEAKQSTPARSNAMPNLFESGSSNFFKSGPTTFGQSPTLFGSGSKSTGGTMASFGMSSGMASSAFGSSSFLDIKPPGSSTENPPIFTFGSSTKITLPTPSLPPPPQPAPFGAFGNPSGTSHSSYGVSFGGNSNFQSRPLFEIPSFSVPAINAPRDEMEDDNEGEMDAKEYK